MLSTVHCTELSQIIEFLDSVNLKDEKLLNANIFCMFLKVLYRKSSIVTKKCVCNFFLLNKMLKACFLKALWDFSLHYIKLKLKDYMETKSRISFMLFKKCLLKFSTK